MNVFAFVGSSGTGKSYRALFVARQRGIDYIIDDGILIGNSKVIAGISAKKEQTKVGAIRRACFFDKAHTDNVKAAIQKYHPDSIMIIATSKEMAETIRTALDLDEIREIIHIEDVATAQEISKALKVREMEGKHVIPVPTFELRKTFSGYFMDALKVFSKKDDANFVAEKTIVRPVYSYLGRYTIADTVIKDIVRYELSKEASINRISSIEVSNCDDNVCVTAYVIINYADLDKSLFRKLQEIIKEEIEQLTCMNVIESNVVVKSIKV